MSYQLVDRALLGSLGNSINTLREKVGLMPLFLGEGGFDILNTYKVPFMKVIGSSFFLPVF